MMIDTQEGCTAPAWPLQVSRSFTFLWEITALNWFVFTDMPAKHHNIYLFIFPVAFHPCQWLMLPNSPLAILVRVSWSLPANLVALMPTGCWTHSYVLVDSSIIFFFFIKCMSVILPIKNIWPFGFLICGTFKNIFWVRVLC